ncbi:hypothetical protein EVG20_g11664, partial [Dentipellis fragilis]
MSFLPTLFEELKNITAHVAHALVALNEDVNPDATFWIDHLRGEIDHFGEIMDDVPGGIRPPDIGLLEYLGTEYMQAVNDGSSPRVKAFATSFCAEIEVAKANSWFEGELGENQWWWPEARVIIQTNIPMADADTLQEEPQEDNTTSTPSGDIVDAALTAMQATTPNTPPPPSSPWDTRCLHPEQGAITSPSPLPNAAPPSSNKTLRQTKRRRPTDDDPSVRKYAKHDTGHDDRGQHQQRQHEHRQRPPGHQEDDGNEGREGDGGMGKGDGDVD